MYDTEETDFSICYTSHQSSEYALISPQRCVTAAIGVRVNDYQYHMLQHGLRYFVSIVNLKIHN